VAPAAAYSPSTTAIPAPMARPTRQPARSVDRMRKSDIGPSWRATRKPSPNPISAECTGGVSQQIVAPGVVSVLSPAQPFGADYTGMGNDILDTPGARLGRVR
jgi:hypothetical protein